MRRYARLVLAALLPAPRLIAQTRPLLVGWPPQWGLAAGYGVTWHLNHGRSNEHGLLFDPAAGFRVSSRLEYIVEGHFARYFTPGGTMFGVMPLGGRLYLGSACLSCSRTKSFLSSRAPRSPLSSRAQRGICPRRFESPRPLDREVWNCSVSNSGHQISLRESRVFS